MKAKKYGVALKWLTVTCFEFKFGPTSIVSDPFITDSPGTELTWEAVEACDIITLSHAHWDHITDIPKLVDKFHPLLLTGDQTAEPLARWLNYMPSRIYPMSPNLELDFDSVKIQALFGRHTDLKQGYCDQLDRLAENPLVHGDPHIAELQAFGSLEYRNYLYTLPGGTTVLLWGNDPTVEQKNMVRALHPDIAILQLSKQDPVEMAAFAAAIGCKVLIPHHMDLKATEAEYMPKVNRLRDEFLARVPDAAFICPQHGQWIEL